MCSPTSHECKAHGRHHERGDCLMCKEKSTCAYNNRPSYASLESQLTEAKSLKEYAIESNRINAERAEKAEAERDELFTKWSSMNCKEQENKRLRELMQWFVDRCDKGEIRSQRTYLAFKKALKEE